jgi:hypothetical protein
MSSLEMPKPESDSEITVYSHKASRPTVLYYRKGNIIEADILLSPQTMKIISVETALKLLNLKKENKSR